MSGQLILWLCPLLFPCGNPSAGCEQKSDKKTVFENSERSLPAFLKIGFSRYQIAENF
jgi:hypothetical protein